MENGIARELIMSRRQMASKRTLSFSSTVFRKKFRAGMTVRNYRDNEVVFSQGDAADAVFYIQRGTVKLTVAATRRKKAIIAVLLRGSFFGEGCLGGQSLRISTARSIGQSNITRLLKERQFTRSSETRSLQRCLLPICFPGLFE
jgi:CRP/FNR family transcriptional regulator, cyclic AMP receptor protein